MLANFLGLHIGDELIVKFKEISDIPPDAPFAPVKEAGKSIVMRVSLILGPSTAGNFFSVNQPDNTF